MKSIQLFVQLFVFFGIYFLQAGNVGVMTLATITVITSNGFNDYTVTCPQGDQSQIFFSKKACDNQRKKCTQVHTDMQDSLFVGQKVQEVCPRLKASYWIGPVPVSRRQQIKQNNRNNVGEIKK